MKIINKTLAVLIAVVIMLGTAPIIMPPATAVQTFGDIGGHWAQADIRRLNELGSLEDFSSGNFRPNDPITRAEFFSLVVRTLGATVRGDISRFTDMNQDDWYYDTVAIAVNMGIANGYDDNTMRPNNSLTRQDAATIAARALGMSSKNELIISRFTDNSTVSSYARTYVAAFAEKGLITGYPDGTLCPLKSITRAEAVKIISNIFPNIHMPESTLHNVSLRGGVLVTSPFAELRDVVLYGDVIVGDGVGSGSVLLSNCTIYGCLIVRGGGPNSVTLSNSHVDSIYVASYGAETRIAVNDNSVVPEIETASSFTLSGRGVTNLTILDQAREGSNVKLDGISLDNLHIGGRASKVSMVSGRALNTRFDGAGQDSSLDINESSSVENLMVAVPNVTVTGKGSIRSLLVNNTGVTVEKNPEFTTVGVNFTATVGGNIVSGPKSTTPNLFDRVSNSSLHVALLSNTSSGAPFDQSTLRIETKEGRSAADINVTQQASGRVPLTSQRNRLAYWIGFFIPAPNTTDVAALTYTYADGDPATVRKNLDTVSGRRGLVVYLPVFRKPGAEAGQLKETLYINWGGNVTENLQFVSSALSLSPLTASGKITLEKDFNGNYDDGRGSRFYSINGSTTYFGAEAVRRILNSDNPLGLPSTGNKGLDAINRALTPDEARSILEEPNFAADLTVSTSANSAYSKLSSRGKFVVADAVLAARKTAFATPSAVKAVFDKAVDARLAAESSLLTKINGSGDAAALRKLIETAANAALLDFQTGADPYKSYTNAQKNDMADFLFGKIPYPSLDAVINAIKEYLGKNTQPGKPGPEDITVKSVTANPSRIPAAANATPFAIGNERSVKLTVVTTDNKTLAPEIVGILNPAAKWRADNTNPIARVTVKDDTLILHALRVGSDTLEVTVGGKSATVAVTVVVPVNATGVTVTPKSASIIVGMTQTLVATMTPANATDTIRWSSSNPDVATVDEETGIVTGVGGGVATITAQTLLGYTASSQIRVFRDVNDVVVDPDSIILTPGAFAFVTAYTYAPNRSLRWETSDAAVATAANAGRDATDTRVHTGRIAAPTTAPLVDGIATAIVTLTVEGSDPDNNDGSGRETVAVTVKPNTGVNARLERAVMYSGEPQQLFLEIEDKALQNQKYYVKVEGGAGGSKAAQCVNGERTPVGVNDVIIIKANDDGVGVVSIGLYTNPDHTGDRVGPELTVVISPQGVSGVSFNHSGTSVLIPNTTTVKYPAGQMPTNTENRGQILEMKLADSTTVTPMVNQGGSRVPLAQPITWFSYVVNHNRKIMYEVKTEVEVAGTQRIYYILGKDGGRIDKPGGGYYTFAEIFDADVDNEPYDTSVDANGDKVSRYGFFKRILDSDDDTRLLIQRDADMKRENSRLLGVSGGTVNRAGILAPNYDEPTGLAAVALTPARVQINNEKEREQWYDLYFDTVQLIKEGKINPIIAPESKYRLQKLSDPADANSWQDVADMYAETGISAATYRVLDANGIPVSLTGYVPVLRYGDPFAEANVFYVRILPNDLVRPGPSLYVMPWEPPKNVPFDPTDPDLWGQVEFKPGSTDIYKLYKQSQGAMLETTAVRQDPSYFPYQRAASLPGGDVTPQDMTIVKQGSSLFVNIPIGFPATPPTRDILYYYEIEQYSRLGFSTLDSESNRQSAVRSSTGYPQLTYTLRLIPPQPSLNLTRTIYLADIPAAPAVADTAWDTLFFNALELACGLALIDPTNVRVEIKDSGLFPGGNVFIENMNGSNGKLMRVIGTLAGSISVVITARNDPSKIVSVLYTVEPKPPSWGGLYPLSILSLEDDSPDGAPTDPGQASGDKQSPGGSQTAVSDITDIKLRSNAGVAVGKTTTLAPYVTPYDANISGLTWTSSDSSVATVSGGRVTGIKTGTATITASDPSGRVKAACNLTVKVNAKPVTSITVSRKTLSLDVGASSALSVVYKPSNATIKGVTWTSGDATVARIDPDGLVSGVSAGTAVLTAVSDSGERTATCTVTVKAPSAAGSVTLPELEITLKVGAKYQLEPTQHPPDPSIQKFTYSTKSSVIASVSTTGMITAKKAGTTVITVKAGGKSATCTVKVVK